MLLICLYLKKQNKTKQKWKQKQKQKQNQKTPQKTEKNIKKKNKNKKQILLSEPGLEFNCVCILLLFPPFFFFLEIPFFFLNMRVFAIGMQTPGGGSGIARFNVATPTNATVTCTAYVLPYNF